MFLQTRLPRVRCTSDMITEERLSDMVVNQILLLFADIVNKQFFYRHLLSIQISHKITVEVLTRIKVFLLISHECEFSNFSCRYRTAHDNYFQLSVVKSDPLYHEQPLWAAILLTQSGHFRGPVNKQEIDELNFTNGKKMGR